MIIIQSLSIWLSSFACTSFSAPSELLSDIFESLGLHIVITQLITFGFLIMINDHSVFDITNNIRVSICWIWRYQWLWKLLLLLHLSFWLLLLSFLIVCSSFHFLCHIIIKGSHEINSFTLSLLWNWLRLLLEQMQSFPLVFCSKI